jgi:endonuclease III-like uncharacterized protein
MASNYKLRITAEDRTKGAFGAVNKNLNKIKGALAVAFSATVITNFARQTLELADTIGKTADSIGVSTGFLQKYQFAAQQSGLTTEEFNKSMQNFTKMVGQSAIRTNEVGRTLEKLGINIKNTDGSVKESEKVFKELFTALDGVGSEFEKNAILADVFGRVGVKLAVMAQNGSEAMFDLAESATGVIPDESIRKAEAFNDAMNRIKRQLLLPLQTAFIDTANAILNFAEAMGLITPDLFTKSFEELNALLIEAQDNYDGIVKRQELFGKRSRAFNDDAKAAAAAEVKRLEDAIEKKQKQIDLQEKLNAANAAGNDQNSNNFPSYFENVNKSIQVTKDFADTIEGQLTNAFKNFFDYTNKQFLDFKNLATSVARAVFNELINVFIVQKLVGMVTGSISDIGATLEGSTSKAASFTNSLSIPDIFEGGGFTGYGARAGGLDGKGGFMAMLHPNETVIDHTRGQSMGGGANVTFNISTVDAKGFDELLKSRKGMITTMVNQAFNSRGKMGIM